MTEEENDYCLSCDSTEGFDYRKGHINIIGGIDQTVNVIICNNCGYIHMYKTMRKRRKKPFSRRKNSE